MKAKQEHNIYYFLFKYLWFIAILRKEAQFIILMLLLAYIISLRKLKFSMLAVSLLAVNTIYLFSIIYAAVFGGHELSRVLAAVNMCMISYAGITYFAVYSQINLDLDRMKKYMLTNLLVLAAVYVLFLFAGERGNVSFLHLLCGYDVFNMKGGLRFRGYLEFTNCVVFMYLYCMPYAFSCVAGKYGSFASKGFELLSLAVIFGSHSRIGIASCTGAVILSVLLAGKIRAVRTPKLLKAALLIALLILGLVLLDKIIAAVNFALDARAGSTSTRFYIYTESMKRMLKEYPLFGFGVRDRINGGFPYGSHSTYISMFYRVGLVGGSLFLLIVMIIIAKINNTPSVNKFMFLEKISFIALYACFIFEDLDGVDWSVAVFYALLGIFFNQRRNIIAKSCAEKN